MSDSPLRLRPGVVAQSIQGEMLLLDTEAGSYFDLNPSGTLMLEGLLAGQGFDEVIARVLQQFEAEGARVRADLLTLLAALRAARLVEDGPQPPA
ncbi:MAG: PqqD family protein [Xanthomonadales bacterium]|nr:hypothetical protein [Xanthomonadales bacterium]MCC6592096.1 PqqD family protein [Xanthomonadales bacterium]MCE7932310.1 PqqD family protein [Xanthomonadales bacterium PRO6]